ncbi:MAG TPA: polysaccharide lyase 8 family protein [Beutenbergiaceae bacterium]|nr:polysaccharide lyase 8 family protein [Beutenbergiaceae bacterium]
MSAGLFAGSRAFSVFSPSAQALAARADTEDEFELILQRYSELMAGPPDADTSHPQLQEALAAMSGRTEELLTLIEPGPDRDRVFDDLPLVDLDYTSEIQSTALQLSELAQSWAAPGSPYQHDEELGTVIIDGLRTLHDLQYHAGKEEFGNWYHWEIGAPRGILEAAALLRAELPEGLRTDLTDAVEYFKPDPGYMYPPDDERHGEASGSNRLFFCQNVAIAGALAGDGDRIQLASDQAAAPLAPNLDESGNGFYPDGSLIAHNNIPYTGTYGRAQLTASSYLLASIGGTQWDLDPEDVQPFRDAIARAFFPWISSAQTLQPVCGRAVANGNLTSAWMMGSILMLAEGAPQEMAAEWHAYIKGQLQRTTEVDFFGDRTLPEALLAQQLLDSDVEGVPEDLGPRLFPKMDRVLARGAGWCFSLATASRRTRGYETMSGENIKGWHQGSAARYLHLESDQGQYFDWFPTVDPFRMPGTTIDSQFLDYEENSAPTYDSFVGGSQAGGTKLADGFYDEAQYASWVQGLSSRDSDMTAKLSWFFLGEVIACLGSDIQGGSGSPIETILENRAQIGTRRTPIAINGRTVGASARVGWQDTVAGVRSFTVPDTASVIALDADMEVNFLHEERTGSWSDISATGDDTAHSNTFYTAWLDHGPLPEGGGFAYLYAPLAGAERAARLETDSGVQVLRNDDVVQAVRAPDLGVIGANFHDSDTIETDGLQIFGPLETSVTVLYDLDEGRMEIALSAPCQFRTIRTFTITLREEWDVEVVRADPTVSIEQDGNTLKMRLDSSDVDGRSHHVELQW